MYVLIECKKVVSFLVLGLKIQMIKTRHLLSTGGNLSTLKEIGSQNSTFDQKCTMAETEVV